MSGKAASAREQPALMIAIAALWVAAALGTPAGAGAQDRLWGDRELVPPLRLVEEDFKKGFSRTYRFPCDEPSAGGHFNRCEGTIMLSYAPGKRPAVVHASINYREIYYRPGEAKDGTTVELGPYSYTVSWSGDLEPVDDDPEGKFPAQRFNLFGPDVRPVMRCDDPEIRIVPGSGTILVDLVLMQEIGGTIYRDTYIRIQVETDIRTWAQTGSDRSQGRWEDSGWRTWWMCGPPASQAEEEEKSLAIEGCTDLLKGGKGQVTAKARSEGGNTPGARNPLRSSRFPDRGLRRRFRPGRRVGAWCASNMKPRTGKRSKRRKPAASSSCARWARCRRLRSSTTGATACRRSKCRWFRSRRRGIC